MRTVRAALIDPDSRRRASATFSISRSDFYLEPFESVSEFMNIFKKFDILLLNYAYIEIADIISDIIGRGKWVPIVAYSKSPTPAQVVAAVQEGACGYLTWPFSSSDLGVVIEQVLGQSDQVASSRRNEVHARHLLSSLTRREKSVLAGMANGLSNVEIGQSLSISQRTVEAHRANLLTKMRLRHSAEAVRIAIEAGLDGLLPISSLPGRADKFGAYIRV
jgi:two-component system response regulator FixJ